MPRILSIVISPVSRHQTVLSVATLPQIFCVLVMFCYGYRHRNCSRSVRRSQIILIMVSSLLIIDRAFLQVLLIVVITYCSFPCTAAFNFLLPYFRFRCDIAGPLIVYKDPQILFLFVSLIIDPSVHQSQILLIVIMICSLHHRWTSWSLLILPFRRHNQRSSCSWSQIFLTAVITASLSRYHWPLGRHLVSCSFGIIVVVLPVFATLRSQNAKIRNSHFFLLLSRN